MSEADVVKYDLLPYTVIFQLLVSLKLVFLFLLVCVECQNVFWKTTNLTNYHIQKFQHVIC